LSRQGPRLKPERGRADDPVDTMTKECPMCNEIMRVRMAERVDTIPGTQQTTKREYKEWVCPECDYFEDVEPEELLEAQ
jgi:C4-type Zn-finger protein